MEEKIERMETKLIKNLAALLYEQRYASSEKEREYVSERERVGNKKKDKVYDDVCRDKISFKKFVLRHALSETKLVILYFMSCVINSFALHS